MAADAGAHCGSGGAIRQGVKKTTIATYWIKLTKFFSWLVLKGYLASNPLKNKALEFPRIRYDHRKYLEQKDMKKILRLTCGKDRSLMSQPHTSKDLSFVKHPTKPSTYVPGRRNRN